MVYVKKIGKRKRGNKMIRRWTKEELDLVKYLAKTGFSSTQIAKELGNGRTRNSVVGACSRNGIQLGSKIKETRVNVKFKDRIPLPRPKAVPRPKPVRFAPEPLPIEEIKFKPCNKKILELEYFDCRAILGEVNGADTVYCGDKVKEGKRWCAYHHAKYFVKPERKTA
jgi:GcrA cell cycle regulator